MEQKKILVAVDSSEHSHKVVETAIEFVRMMGGRVVFVHCHKNFPSMVGSPERDREVSAIIHDAGKLVKPFIDRLREADILVEERLMEEPAGAAISNIAKIEKCNMIIMGSRGLSNLASLIVGSVTHRVLQTAPCSVLVVR